MAPPSCHGWNVPTASLRAMGPEDLPSLLAGSAEVVPAGELEGHRGRGPAARAQARLSHRARAREPPGRLPDRFWNVLDPDRAEVGHTAEGLEQMSMEAILRLTASTT